MADHDAFYHARPMSVLLANGEVRAKNSKANYAVTGAEREAVLKHIDFFTGRSVVAVRSANVGVGESEGAVYREPQQEQERGNTKR